MRAGLALLTGAGISADPPANLPLGAELDELLRRCCFEAAAHVAPGVVDADGLKVVAGRRPNLIAHLALSVGAPAVSELLSCFSVRVPNEAHLIAAAHAIYGTLHVTLNFDDGVETAYALLDGSSQLTSDVPAAFHAALDEWRRRLRPTVPLRVVASRFGRVDFGHRPLLVKLRGSAKDSWDQRLVPSRPILHLDALRLSDDQLTALHAATDVDHLAVAGVSGGDTDCLTALVPRLCPGRFSWTAAGLDEEIVALVRRIDPDQPVLLPGIEGMRSALPNAGELPSWPRVVTDGPGFGERFAVWKDRLAVHAVAEAYVRLLSEAGLHDQAVGVASALAARRAAR